MREIWTHNTYTVFLSKCSFSCKCSVIPQVASLRWKKPELNFFSPPFWAEAQCHGSAAGEEKFKPENAIELKSVRHCSAHKLYIQWWLQNFACEWTEIIVCLCPQACCLEWDSIKVSYRTPKLEKQYTKACLQEGEPSFFITNVAFWYLVIILYESVLIGSMGCCCFPPQM